jgi:hypothetical protein
MADAVSKKASQKEAARQYRKDAYRKMKEQRAADPKYQAMKEAVKLRRREMYQEIKAKRKTEARDVKSKIQVQKTEARASKDAELMKAFKLQRSPVEPVENDYGSDEHSVPHLRLVPKGPYDVN